MKKVLFFLLTTCTVAYGFGFDGGGGVGVATSTRAGKVKPDGTTTMVDSTGKITAIAAVGSAAFSAMTGQPTDNANLATALGSKMNAADNYINFADYGTSGVGNDNSAALATVTTIALTTGRPIYFPPGYWKFTQQWVIPNDGATPPKQKPLTIIGAGADFTQTTSPNGGTIMDFTYGSGPKITTLGMGALSITGVTFYNSGTDTQPFLYTTNTCIRIIGCTFFGGANKNDGLLLGGTGATDGFQGYVSLIDNNHFNYINCAIKLRKWANAVNITNNFLWTSCGGEAAFIFDPTDAGPTEIVSGLYVAGNTIEVTNYTYGMKMYKTSLSSFISNSFYDGTTATAGYYLADSSVRNNTFIESVTNGSNIVFMSGDATSISYNNIIRNITGPSQTAYGVGQDLNGTVRMQVRGPEIHKTSDLNGSEYAQNYFYFASPKYVLQFNMVDTTHTKTITPLAIQTYPDGNWSNPTTDMQFGSVTARYFSTTAQMWSDSITFRNVDGSYSSTHASGNFTVNRKFRFSSMPQLTLNSATPDVSASGVFYEANSNPTTITSFSGSPTAGDSIAIECTTANTTIQNNSGIVISSGSDFVCAADKVIRLLRNHSNTKWLQQ